jgi:hypothetical protein
MLNVLGQNKSTIEYNTNLDNKSQSNTIVPSFGIMFSAHLIIFAVKTLFSINILIIKLLSNSTIARMF